MRHDLIDRIKGPVFPVLPAFTPDEALDEDATRRYVRYLSAGGARILLATAGTSRLGLLEPGEIDLFNRIVAEEKGDAVAVAANPDHGSLAAALRHAKTAEQNGADAFLLYFPERYYDDKTVVDFFASVAAEIDIPVLVHAIPMRCASTGPTVVHPFTVELFRKLLDIPNVIGMKEENGSEGLRQRLGLEFGADAAIIAAGGGMGKFLACGDLGVQAYLTGLGNLDPRIELSFYDAVQTRDFDAARKTVRDFEQPFFDVAVPIGWHVALKSALAILGLAPPHERRPLRPPTAEQVAALKAIIEKLGVETA